MLPHPLQPKASLCSLGQSSSSPRRVKCSPHPLHSRTICPEVSTECSSPSPCQDSPDSCMSFIPLLLLLLCGGTHRARATIDTGGPHEPLGLPPPYRPRNTPRGGRLHHRVPLPHMWWLSGAAPKMSGLPQPALYYDRGNALRC